MNISERIKEIAAGRHVLKSLIARNLKDRYGGAVLGILWTIINPFLIALVITFVFTFVMKSGIRHYPLFVLSGLFPWFFFSNSVVESATCLKQNQGILNKFSMPKEIVPLSVVFSNFINFLIGFAIIVPAFIVFNGNVAGSLILLAVIILLFFVFTIGVSLCFCVFNVYLKDVSQLLNVGTMFLFWLTPIFYDLETIPVKYHWIIFLNPVFCYIAIFQSLLYEGSPAGLSLWIQSVFSSLVSIAVGYFLFIRNEEGILKYI